MLRNIFHNETELKFKYRIKDDCYIIKSIIPRVN
jgi:hypothetical protein